MPLQIRLRHAMGERILDVTARAPDKPFLIGRAPTADLQLPSIKVKADHCALFVQAGRWLLVDHSGGATRLNGEPLPGPTPLKVGDVIVLTAEEKPTSITIEPGRAAAGQAGTPVREGVVMAAPAAQNQAPRAAPTPPPAGASTPPGVFRPAPLPPPGTRPRPLAPAVAALPQAMPRRPIAPAAAPVPVAAVSDDAINFGADFAASPPLTTRARVRKKSGSPVGAIIGVLLAFAIIGGTGYFIFRYMHRLPDQLVTIIQPPTIKKVTVLPPTTAPTSRPVIAETQPVEDMTDKANDENPETEDHTGDLEWTDVQVAHDMSNQAAALLRYDDYARRNPGKNAPTLKKYEQEAIDRLWWTRITQLWQDEGKIKSDIATKDREIIEEGNDAFKAKLVEEKGALEARLKADEKVLRVDMGYTSDILPNLADEQSLNVARAARDKSKYIPWARETAQYIRLHGGQTPWGEAG